MRRVRIRKTPGTSYGNLTGWGPGIERSELSRFESVEAYTTRRKRGPAYPSRSTSPRNISTGRTQYE